MRSRIRTSLGFLAGFEAAARTLSFTAAAAELNLTQSAMSRQIKSLEEALGLVLFERFNRRLALTAAGEALHRTVGGMLRAFEQTIADLRPGSQPNLVTVSTPVPFAALWLVPRLADFQRAHPSVDVRIAADNQILDIAARGIDVAVRFCRPEIAPAGSTALFEEEIFPVCAPALVRDTRRPLRVPRDLARHVLLELDDPRRDPLLDWMQWLSGNGLSALAPAGRLRFNHYDQLIQAAISGEGVALGRSPLIARFLDQGALVAPFRGRAASPRKYFLVRSPQAADAPAVRAFVEWLKTAASNPAQATVPPTDAKARDRRLQGARPPGARRGHAARKKASDRPSESAARAQRLRPRSA